MNYFLAQGRDVNLNSIAYILRCNAPDLTSKKGFQWAGAGAVEAPDWNPTPECGKGLHGWLDGEGDHDVSDHWNNDKAVWLIAAVWLGDVVDLGGKVKFPRAWVVFSGTRDDATREIVRLGSKKPVMFANLTCGDNESQVGGYKARLQGGDHSTNTGGNHSTNTGGYKSTNTGGYYSTNTGGYRSVNKGGHKSTNKGGEYSTNTGGDFSTNTGGYYSTNTGGEKSTLIWKTWDGTMYRFHTFYTGEGGILPNVPYKWIEGKPVAQK